MNSFGKSIIFGKKYIKITDLLSKSSVVNLESCILELKKKYSRPLVLCSDNLPNFLNIHFSADSYLKIVIFCDKGRDCKINIDLEGVKSRVEVYILHTLKQEHTSFFDITVNHLNSNTSSNILSKSILEGSAKFEFLGKIYICSTADKSSALMYNKNLLVSDMATIKSSPSLEILCDNIVCKHGTVSLGIEELATFYTSSRGLSAENSKIILKHAFADEIISKLDSLEKT